MCSVIGLYYQASHGLSQKTRPVTCDTHVLTMWLDICCVMTRKASVLGETPTYTDLCCYLQSAIEVSYFGGNLRVGLLYFVTLFSNKSLQSCL